MNWLGFKKHLTGILVALGAIVLSVGTGFSTFYFYEAATASSSVNDVPDDIRENQTFGTNDDSITDTTKYYDVYFMPQMVDLTDYEDTVDETTSSVVTTATDAWTGIKYTNLEVTTSSGKTKTVRNYETLPDRDTLFYRDVDLDDKSIAKSFTSDPVTYTSLNSTINYDPSVDYTDDNDTTTQGMWVPAYGYMDPDTRKYWGEEVLSTTFEGNAATSSTGANGGTATWSSYKGSVYPLTYRKYSNVRKITNDMLAQVGTPKACMYDCMTTMYKLAFCSWSVSYISGSYKYYSNKTDDYTDTATNWPGNYPFEVSGSFPTNFEIAYFGTSLDLYEEKAVYINGTPTLFFYPVYSTGKGYYELNKDGYGKDAIRTNYYTGGNQVVESLPEGYKNPTFLPYDTTNTNSISSIKSGDSTPLANVECYRYSNINFTSKAEAYTDENAISFSTDPGVNGSRSWLGTWHPIYYEGSPFIINRNTGVFNIYVFVLVSTSSSETAFTSDETELIINCMIDPDVEPYVQPYESYDCETITVDSNYRDYFIVFEKVYEPRLIAGPTKTFDYESTGSINTPVIREEPTGIEKDSFSCSDITFDFENDYVTYDYTSPNTGYTYRFTDYFFSFTLAKNDAYNSYIVSPVNESSTYSYSIPEIQYVNASAAEQYKSKSILISILEEYNVLYKYEHTSTSYLAYEAYVESFALDFQRLGVYISGKFTCLADLEKVTTVNGVTSASLGYTNYLEYAVTTMQNLIRPLEIGVYNLAVHINYDTTSHRPSTIDVWAHKKHNYFVNVNGTDKGTEATQDSTSSSSGDVSYYANVTDYDYQYSSYYYLLSYIMPTDEYNYKVTTTVDGTESTTTSTTTFLQILSNYHQQGKCLQDRVTGKYITYQDYQNYSDALAEYSSSISAGLTATAPQASAYNLFQITGNHILQAVAEPSWVTSYSSSSAEALL